MEANELTIHQLRPKFELTEETLPRFVTEFLKEVEVMPSTKQLYAKCLKYFTAYLLSKEITLPARAEIIEWKNEMQKTLRARTVNTRLGAIKAFFSWMESKFYYPNITAKIKAVPVSNTIRAREALSEKKSQLLLQSIHRDRLAGKRDYAIILLAVHTAMRTIEMSEANVGDIRIYEGMENPNVAALLWIRRKGHAEKDDYVVLSQPVIDAIGDYLEARSARGETLNPEDPLFVTESFRRTGRMAVRSIRFAIQYRMDQGLVGKDRAKISPHSLRHTAITMALQGGAGLQDAQAMAGHKSINTTLIYDHSLKRIKNAAETKILTHLARCKNLPPPENIRGQLKILRSDNIPVAELPVMSPDDLAAMTKSLALGTLPEDEKIYAVQRLKKLLRSLDNTN